LKEQSLELIYENLLMEKDHRQKMMKFGIPEDVANFLHDFDDKYSLWFANQFKQMPEFERAANKLTFVTTKRQQMQQIIDWVKGAQTVNLNEYKWDTALPASEEWHKLIARPEDEIVTDLSHTVEELESGNGTILKVYKDGYYWIDKEMSNCREEGDCMGHCGNTKAETIWSLRHVSKFYTGGTGRNCNSYITVAVSPDENKWYQAKGKANTKPKPEYWDYIADIFVDNEIFSYDTEYASDKDFGVEEFKSVIEDNPEKYPNGDEIIEKLGESGISAKAEKLFAEYNDRFTYLSVDYEVEDAGDNRDYIDARAYYSITINSEMMPEVGYLEAWHLEDYFRNRKDSIEIRKKRNKFLSAIIETCDDYRIYLAQDWEYGTPFEFEEKDGKFELRINFDFRNERDGYGDELDHFKNFLEEMDSVNDVISKDDFEEDFIETFKEELVKVHLIPDPEDENAPEPPKPEDPRQMKFDFGESSTFKDYAKFIGMV
jgi:hypothetical protein